MTEPSQMSKAKRDTRVLATYNIKGGVGKTSAAVNLAYLAAQAGHPTLLWDLDPQAASTYLFRVRPKVKGGGRGLLRKRSYAGDHVKATDHENLDLLPADFSYRHLDLALDQFKKPAARLRKVLAPLRDDYDYIFLDCPPSISLVSEAVFEASDALLVPVIPATLSSRAYEQLEELSRRARSGVRTSTSILAFFSMADVSKQLHLQVMERLRKIDAADRARRRDPRLRRGRDDGGGAQPGGRVRGRVARRGRLRGALGGDRAAPAPARSDVSRCDDSRLVRRRFGRRGRAGGGGHRRGGCSPGTHSGEPPGDSSAGALRGPSVHPGARATLAFTNGWVASSGTSVSLSTPAASCDRPRTAVRDPTS